MKYFFGFSATGTGGLFSYLTRNSFRNLFDERHIPYTFDIDEEGITDALIPSGEDYFAFYTALKKRHIKAHVIACNDFNDYYLKWTPKEPVLSLTFHASDMYKRADSLWINFASQEEFLRKNNIKTPVRYMPVHVSCESFSGMSDTEKKAFRSCYQVQEGREIILSYGYFSQKNIVNIFQTAAQNLPDKEFLFFGHGERDAVTQKTLERVTQPANIHFLDKLPEPLYRSAIYSANRLLLIGDHLSYPQILVDCMYHKIPLISYKLVNYPEIVNEKTTLLCNSFSELFHALYDKPDPEKIENAYQSAVTLSLLTSLHSPEE